MRYKVIFLLTCSTSLNLFSQEIDLKKIVEDKKKEEKVFDKARTGFFLKFGGNTFLGSGTPNYLQDKSYKVPFPSTNQMNETVTVKPNSSQGVVSFDNHIGLTEISYGRCYGFNASFGYKAKLLNKLYFSLEGCYNYTRRNGIYSPNLGVYILQTAKNGMTSTTNSISLPVAILFQLNKRLNFEIGLNIRYNMYNLNPGASNEYGWIEKPNFLSKSSISAFVGVNYNITKNVFVNARYYIGDRVIFSDWYNSRNNDNYGSSANTLLYDKNVTFLPARSVYNQLQFSIGFNLN